MSKDASIAIAYEMKRKNAKKLKMAQGGEIKQDSASLEARPQPSEMAKDKDMIQKAKKQRIEYIPAPTLVKSSVIKPSRVDALGRKIPDMKELEPQKHEGMSEDKAPEMEEFMDDEMRPQLAEGGMLEEMDEQPMDDDEQQEEKHASIAAAIMARKAKMMAEGGEVDIDSNNDEAANIYDKLNRAALKENYDEDLEDISEPMDSNEHGDEIDSDKHDMISQIRSKMRSLRR